jgi:FeS assembly SUF system protein
VIQGIDKGFAMDDDYKLPGSVASLPVLNPLQNNASSASVQGPSTSASTPALRTSAMPDSIEKKLLEGKIIAAISKVYDPEIPVNVYELGLIYGIDIFEDKSVTVRMTLTAPGCPVAGSLPLEVEKQVEGVDEVKEADVVLVWEPAWDKSRMSEAAMLMLNLS